VGNKGGRPKLNIASLADELAGEVMKEDLALVHSNPTTKEGKFRRAQALERASRMCKGRVPTRIAIAGDEGGSPVPFSYVEVGSGTGVAVESKNPTPKKKPRLKRKHSLSRIAKKKKKR